MITILDNINAYIDKYLEGTIENPILKKVIIDEIDFSDNLIEIIRRYLSETVLTGEISKLNTIIEMINNVQSNNQILFIKKKSFIQSIQKAFLLLTHEEQLFLILNINDNNIGFYKSLNKNEYNEKCEIMSDILKNIGFLLISNKLFENTTNKINIHEYIIKYITACNIIDTKYGLSFMEEYINTNCLELMSNDILFAYFLHKYPTFSNFKRTSINIFIKNIELKLESVKIFINYLPLDNMIMAYEIYKLGKIILDSKLAYDFTKNIIGGPLINDVIKIPNFTNEQLEYIVKSIHTCLINNNMIQAKTILSIIYYMNDKDISKFLEYYNHWLLIRMKKQSNMKILEDEEEIWHINDLDINKLSIFSKYIRIINNIKYSNNINDDLQKVNVNKLPMNKVNVTLVNTIEKSNIQEIKHHCTIQNYITGLDKYIKKRSKLQSIEHDNINSKITFNTSYGSIKCSLLLGSILLHLNDGDKTINELMNIMNIQDIIKYIKILQVNNLVVDYVKDTNVYYKYVQPFGEVLCDEFDMSGLTNTISLKYSNFTDIILTIDSRIVNETKLASKINIIELERKIQEFLKDEYVRTIFYQRIESLKARYYIEQNNDMITYVV